MTFNRQITTVFNVIILFLLTGCTTEKVEPPIVVAEVAKEFALQMRETLDSSGREFVVRVATLRQYECSNYAIQYIWRNQGNAMLLSLLRIAAPLTCDYKSGSIFAETNAGKLTNGNYSFSVDLRGAIINKGTLSVLPDRYRLRMETEHGLVIEHKELLKVPSESLWGYITYAPPQKEEALQIVQELFSLTQAINQPRGYYGYYSIDEKGISVEGQPGEDAFTYPFLRKLPSNPEIISSLVERYRKLYPSGIKIYIKDGKGRAY